MRHRTRFPANPRVQLRVCGGGVLEGDDPVCERSMGAVDEAPRGEVDGRSEEVGVDGWWVEERLGGGVGIATYEGGVKAKNEMTDNNSR